MQQENQRQIVGKLLHDLRNPVHSIRISMELFGRLARRTGDVDTLMERAAAYVDPAEAAVKNLVTNCERLARYVVVAAPAELQPFPVEEMVAEVILLLRAARRRLPVTCTLPGDAALNVHADRIRVCHVLLHTCLNNPASAVAMTVRIGTNGLVVLDVAFQAGAADEAAPRERTASRGNSDHRRDCRRLVARRDGRGAVDGIQARGRSAARLMRAFYFVDQPSRIERLRPELIEQRLLLGRGLFAAGERDQRRLAELRHLPQPLRQLVAVHSRQPDVDQHQHRRVVRDDLQRRLRIAGTLRGNVFQLQQHREAGGGICAVVDDQDLHAANYLLRGRRYNRPGNLCSQLRLLTWGTGHAEARHGDCRYRVDGRQCIDRGQQRGVGDTSRSRRSTRPTARDCRRRSSGRACR